MPDDAKALAFWTDRVPRSVAIDQAAWERRQRAIRARAAGLTYCQIAVAMRISVSRTRQMTLYPQRFDQSPAELWIMKRSAAVPVAVFLWKRHAPTKAEAASLWWEAQMQEMHHA